MASLRRLETEVAALKERNRRVEADKAWETSSARKVILAVLTYVVVAVLFLTMRLPYPFLNALIPSVAFLISTFSLPFFKKVWLRYRG